MTFSKVCRITPLEPAAAPAFDLIDLLEDDARPPVVLGGVDEAADLDNIRSLSIINKLIINHVHTLTISPGSTPLPPPAASIIGILFFRAQSSMAATLRSKVMLMKYASKLK